VTIGTSMKQDNKCGVVGKKPTPTPDFNPLAQANVLSFKLEFPVVVSYNVTMLINTLQCLTGKSE